MNTKGKSILVVDDEEKIRHLIKLYLEKEGYEVIEAQDGEEALGLIKKIDPCFVILDLKMPKVSGEEVCKTIRLDMKSDIPIIMVTAKGDEKSRIAGLRMGADDYITKPFSLEELAVRIETVLRRAAHRCGKICYRGLTIKPLRGEVHYQGERIFLTQHEFRLLHFLMRHPNQVLTREQIIEELDPNHKKIVLERTIDVHIGNLREKLKFIGENGFISTVRGMGFRFDAF